ncbi:MAG: hypothetical protein EA406_00985 [Rhodospirillales bacterium]|nr:MAG: hypothetical protein EA406_00985 [Rhodospirillales bacterium]
MALALAAFAPGVRADLTPSDVERFIATITPFRSLASAHPRELEPVFAVIGRPLQSKSRQPFSAAVDRLRPSPAYDALSRAVAEGGFSSPEAWAVVADRVARAYATVHFRDQPEALARRIERARRAVENNPRLTPEDREALLGELTASAAVLDRFQAPPSDTDAVRPHMAALRSAFSEPR